jgi:hypothetical protein
VSWRSRSASRTVFDDPAFKINRLSGRWRQLDSNCVTHDPSDFLQIFPRPFPRSSGGFQLVQQVLQLLRRHGSTVLVEHAASSFETATPHATSVTTNSERIASLEYTGSFWSSGRTVARWLVVLGFARNPAIFRAGSAAEPDPAGEVMSNGLWSLSFTPSVQPVIKGAVIPTPGGRLLRRTAIKPLGSSRSPPTRALWL